MGDPHRWVRGGRSLRGTGGEHPARGKGATFGSLGGGSPLAAPRPAKEGRAAQSVGKGNAGSRAGSAGMLDLDGRPPGKTTPRKEPITLGLGSRDPQLAE